MSRTVPSFHPFWCDNCAKRSIVQLGNHSARIACIHCHHVSLLEWCEQCETHVALSNWHQKWMCPVCKIPQPTNIDLKQLSSIVEPKPFNPLYALLGFLSLSVSVFFALAIASARNQAGSATISPPEAINELVYTVQRGSAVEYHAFNIDEGSRRTLARSESSKQPVQMSFRDSDTIVFTHGNSRYQEVDLKTSRISEYRFKISRFGSVRTGAAHWCMERDRFVLIGSGIAPKYGWIHSFQPGQRFPLGLEGMGRAGKLSRRSAYADVACSPNGEQLAAVDVIKTNGVLIVPTDTSSGKSVAPRLLVIMDDWYGEQRQVSQAAMIEYISWSPDGEQVLFVSQSREGLQQVASVNISTKRKTIWAESDSAEFKSPVWSHSGRHIAYVQDNDIVVLNTDNGSRILLTATEAIESAPAWRPPP